MKKSIVSNIINCIWLFNVVLYIVAGFSVDKSEGFWGNGWSMFIPLIGSSLLILTAVVIHINFIKGQKIGRQIVTWLILILIVLIGHFYLLGRESGVTWDHSGDYKGAGGFYLWPYDWTKNLFNE